MKPENRNSLDAWVREVIAWHFNPETGCPFWLEYAKNLSWDPRKEIQTYDDLSRFGFFQDEWLRGGPVRRWVPKGFAGKPVYTFETGGSSRGQEAQRDAARRCGLSHTVKPMHADGRALCFPCAGHAGSAAEG